VILSVIQTSRQRLTRRCLAVRVHDVTLLLVITLDLTLPRVEHPALERVTDVNRNALTLLILYDGVGYQRHIALRKELLDCHNEQDGKKCPDDDAGGGDGMSVAVKSEK